MAVEDVRRALRSDARVVAIEAPAGCGKTYEAAAAAADLAKDLREGRELLLLAHTNAAVGEFRRRVRERKVRVRASTLDAFALELITPYAAALGLPSPVAPGDGHGQVPFRELARKAAELLRRAPSLARALGHHYPVIFLDEHQDTRVEQDQLVRLIVEAGEGRLRTFADPMQAIYSSMDELVNWQEHRQAADATATLENPHRWQDVPELGEWIMRARDALERGHRVPTESLPECVRIELVRGLTDLPNPNSRQVQRALIRVLRRIADGAEGSLAVLTRYNEHARGLNSALRGLVVIQEGGEFAPAYDALDRAEASLGKPRDMALALLGLLAQTCTGLTQEICAQFSRSLLPDKIESGRRERIRPILDCLEALYKTPDLSTWCQALACIVTRSPVWLKVDLRTNLRLLAQIRPGPDDSGRELLDRAIRRYREGAPLPRRCVSTIHKAKGQEYDHVVVAVAGSSIFPASEKGRQLFYTAISRARKSLTILSPDDHPSPLVM